MNNRPTKNLKAVELRRSSPLKSAVEEIRKNEIFFILENVTDTFNVGGIFRLADACAVKSIFLCGDTETPPNVNIKKASVNTWQWVDWHYAKSAEVAVKKLKKQYPDITIVAVEQTGESIDFRSYGYPKPLALVVGNETRGISQETLRVCDYFLEIPMHGINTSLNVIISLGIVAYKSLESECFTN